MFRPVAYMSLVDRRLRERTIGVLERAGWVIIPQPSTSSLLRALARVRECPWLAPSLIVVDARASRSELTAGLRALGIVVPVVLVPASGDPVQLVDAPAIEHARIPEVFGALTHARTSTQEQTA
jgi:hypothetical protein